jgi:2,3-bisphosphoglycerate-independent phosphoglycerate mutase
MKYVLIIGDGMADYPVPELGGKTPLEAAHTPNFDFIASHGTGGLVQTIPEGMAPGSEIATLAIMGYDPRRYYTGRAPLEAASMGVELRPGQIGYRCNLITHENGLIKDYSAGHITTPEARQLITTLDEKLGSDLVRFHPGISYRHLTVFNHTSIVVKGFPPHDIMGRTVADHLPAGPGSEPLRRLMLDSQKILADHPVNRQRRVAGHDPATMIWFWGGGTAAQLPTLQERFGLSGAVISAVDLIRGIGRLAGCQVVEVPGITGYLDTNFTGKAASALKTLETVDFVLVHVEAPDEASHNGKLDDKLRAIESVDQQVVGTILAGLPRFKTYRVMVMPDHRTPVSVRTHTSEPIPFAIFDSRSNGPSGMRAFSESEAAKGKWQIAEGHKLIETFLSS